MVKYANFVIFSLSSLCFIFYDLFLFYICFVSPLVEVPGTPGAESCDSYNIFEPTPLDCISIKSSASSYLHDRDTYGKLALYSILICCVESVPSCGIAGTTLGNAPKAVDP